MPDPIRFEVNANKAMQIMKKLEPQAAKALQDEMKAILLPVTDKAKALVPNVALSRWSKYGWRRIGSMASKDYLVWNPSKVKSGFRVMIGRMKKSGTTKYASVAVMRNMNPSGSIFELAGIRSDSKSNAFVKGLETSGFGLSGSRANGRLLHEAWLGMSVGERHKYEQQIAGVFARLQAETNDALNKGLG